MKEAKKLSNPYKRIVELGIVMPPISMLASDFCTHAFEGNLLHLSCQGPIDASGKRYAGRLGDGVGMEEAYQHARLVGVNLIAVMHDALGDLSRVRRIVKLVGLVSASPDFSNYQQVVNGCSDLLADVFGDVGDHARLSVGVASLPNNETVQVEAIVEIC